jgi:hypothetical protein
MSDNLLLQKLGEGNSVIHFLCLLVCDLRVKGHHPRTHWEVVARVQILVLWRKQILQVGLILNTLTPSSSSLLSLLLVVSYE